MSSPWCSMGSLKRGSDQCGRDTVKEIPDALPPNPRHPASIFVARESATVAQRHPGGKEPFDRFGRRPRCARSRLDAAGQPLAVWLASTSGVCVATTMR